MLDFYYLTMPPSGFNQKAINGLLIFIRECYGNLLEEIQEGKKQESQAIQGELDNIEEYLSEFKI